MFQEQGVHYADSVGFEFFSLICQFDAFLGADTANAEVDRDSAGGLVNHDLAVTLLLFQVKAVWLAVTSQGEDAVHATFNDMVNDLTLDWFVNAPFRVCWSDDRGDDPFDETCIQDIGLLIFFPF